MNPTLHMWLQRSSTFPGVVACGVRSPDRTTLAQSNDPKLPIPRIQNAMREMLEIVDALRESRIGTDRLRWKFEGGQVHCTARPDGALAALLVAAETELSPELDGLLSDFSALSL